MYKYKGDGWIAGVPARDLSETEFNNLDKELQEAVKKSVFYELDQKKSIKTSPKETQEK